WEVYPNPFANLTRGSARVAMVFDRTTQLWQMQWGTTFLYDFYLNQISNCTKVMDNGAYSIIYGGTGPP
ncbi:MAG: hypothetical protein LUO79_05955, partial [Methanomassiliicoccales archaeon]|nr:hypothetical protein [Methanomassiliicoccales archaeon]